MSGINSLMTIIIMAPAANDNKNGKKSLLPIKTDAEWELIDRLLSKMDEEGKNEN